MPAFGKAFKQKKTAFARDLHVGSMVGLKLIFGLPSGLKN
jgi:hypothetical protein